MVQMVVMCSTWLKCHYYAGNNGSGNNTSNSGGIPFSCANWFCRSTRKCGFTTFTNFIETTINTVTIGGPT